MSDKNIDVIKHIKATGKCPEDDIVATSMYNGSGFQPKTPRKDVKVELDLDKFIERTDDLFIGHLQNEIEWFKSRMDAYRESFFKVCDIVEHSDAPDIIKKLVKEEKDRY